MALACDFRIGSQDTEMFMPAARLGLHFYLSGMERYVSRLGVDVAKRLFLTGEKMDAQSMYASAFLTQLVDRAAFDEQLQRLSGTLSAMAPLPLLGMKKHLNHIARGIVDPAAVAADVKRNLHSYDLTGRTPSTTSPGALLTRRRWRRMSSAACSLRIWRKEGARGKRNGARFSRGAEAQKTNLSHRGQACSMSGVCSHLR